jgi:MoaA/NifB/PqqE/SkfB family radical SAM enzyme
MFNYDSTFRLARLYGRAFVRGFTVRRFANAVRTEWAFRRRHIDVQSKPYILFIEPLYYCNLRCPLCPRQVPDFGGQRGKLETDLIHKIFDELGPYLYQCSIFGNGEPTLDWSRTAEVISAARSHKVFTAVSTNATLITESMAERIVDSGLDYLICAIDGVSQEAYESYRVGGSVEDAMAGMQRVVDAKRRKKSRLVIEWQFLVHKQNEHEMDTARALARKMGVSIRFAPLGGMGNEPSEQEKWVASDKRFRKGATPAGVPLKNHHCYWLWRSMYVNATGTLGRCPGYAGTALIGNLRTSSIQEMYNGRTTRNQRRIFNPAPIAHSDAPEGPCDSCTLYVRCHAPASSSSSKVSGAKKNTPVPLNVIGSGEPTPASINDN